MMNIKSYEPFYDHYSKQDHIAFLYYGAIRYNRSIIHGTFTGLVSAEDSFSMLMVFNFRVLW